MGRFLTRDTWNGNFNKPLSLNKWTYVNGNPVNLTDPTGKFPEWCQSMTNKALYETCVDLWYGIEPISYFELGSRVEGNQGCYVGPREYRAPGYLEGVGYWTLLWRFGGETVYDFASMQRNQFVYFGAGTNDAIDLGGGAQVYVGLVSGFRTDDTLLNEYRGISSSGQLGLSGDIGIGVGGGGGAFFSWGDPMVRGVITYIGGSLSADIFEGADFDISPLLFYFGNKNSTRSYIRSDDNINLNLLLSDILSGDQSPILGKIHYNNTALLSARAVGVAMAIKYSIAYQEIRNEIATH